MIWNSNDAHLEEASSTLYDFLFDDSLHIPIFLEALLIPEGIYLLAVSYSNYSLLIIFSRISFSFLSSSK